MALLTGIRVLDFGRFIAGPYCAALLGDLGADVIRIERVEGGEDRYVPPVADTGEGGLYLQMNRNKRCLALNLASLDEMGNVGKIEVLQGRPSTWFPLSELTPASNEPLVPPMQTIQIIGGRREKIRAGDVMGAMTADFGYTRDQTPVRARDLNAQGAMAVLLKDAIKPNLVQTLENNPAIIHGGPFANIAHGCNTVTATQAALKLGEYVVTEAGFGADLGAEKFIDIKCRKSGLRPDCAVVVATLRALKHHGGVDARDLNTPDLAALERGLANLERHVHNIRNHYGLPCVVSINHFTSDTAEELALLRGHMDRQGVPVVVARHWAEGSAGAEELARTVVRLAESGSAQMRLVYADEDSLWEKMRAIATRIYGAADISADAAVRARIDKLQQDGYGHYPVCVAKTQYSFSTDPRLRGAPSGHVVNVREVRLAAGAEFVVMICGDIMTMPGLPREPASSRIDIDDEGRISGLF